MLQVVKLIHVLSIIFWLGSLFVLIVLLKRGAGWAAVSLSSMQELCRKIFFSVTVPSLALALVTAIILLVFKEINFKAGWFHMKMTAVILLFGSTFWVGKLTKAAVEKVRKQSMALCILFFLSLLLALSSIYIVKEKYITEKTVQK